MIVGRHEVDRSTPVHGVTRKDARGFIDRLSEVHGNFARLSGFDGSAGQTVALPDSAGRLAMVLIGLGETPDPFASAALTRFNDCIFTLGEGWGDHTAASLGLLLGLYRFDNYAPGKKRSIKLVAPDTVDIPDVRRIADAVYLTRDLINTPANDLGPAELADAAQALGRKHGARIEITDGEELEIGFPMIAAVGAASPRPPLLIDMTWGEEDAPRLTLVGKGVVFDTGGLNIKPGNSMALMKKDMGGAAAVLALASMIMDAKLRVRLRVLIPAAENSVSGDAYRPGDVLASHKGLTVEIGNTDAEGRLVLADALSLADEEKPDILISMATLTGAARVALGPDLPPLYCDDDQIATELLSSATRVADPLWRMPFWKPYDNLLKSDVADVNHISDGPFAGSITAALFLKRFVENASDYLHFDIFGWVPRAKPGQPKGGEPQGARALFEYFRKVYG